jgi:dTDP-4-dehydrorhamnose 3,5-epimerase
MEIFTTPIEGLKIIKPKIFGDHRGFFAEIYRENDYIEAGITNLFVQDNLSSSVKNTLRGLHFQKNRPQAKLVQVLVGSILDVVVDLRLNSPTFGHHYSILLTSEEKTQFFIPEGFAHGFYVYSETALFLYKCSDFYDSTDEGGLLWSDPALKINWGVDTPILSSRDTKHPLLADLTSKELPQLSGE